ncbi:MAG: peptide chain release factor 2 [Planctomycetota bacterium]|nr:MAG: peptide chain release factor 2 [Planctomycetota bacterium]
MVELTELRARIASMAETLASFHQTLDVEGKKRRIAELEKKMGAPGFWDDPAAAHPLVEELSSLKKAVAEIEDLTARIEEQREFLELVAAEDDDSLREEFADEVRALADEVARFEILTLMSGENEHRNVILSIHAGAGGTESCDWVEMLLRMYVRWLETHGYEYERTHLLSGEEAGIKSVTLEVKGFYPYGHLRSEAGVHRLVRISPFDANARRHTSFASVDVIPIFDAVEVTIDEKDLVIDTYRAGGPGGQHVNKTESAVRITHLPTGIVVQCQNERSQTKNREIAMRELASRVQRYYEAQRDAELKALLGDRGEIAWGNQIRSYVLQPYTLVKDHRTGYEETDVRKVLDGGIDGFIEAYLRWRLERKTKN